MNIKPRDVEVLVTFLLTEHGGRTRGVFSGYRPQFYYGNRDWDAEYTFLDFAADQEVPLGEPVRAVVAYLSPDEHDGRIHAGTPFLVREGNKVVGFGSVTKLLELRESAARLRTVRIQSGEQAP